MREREGKKCTAIFAIEGVDTHESVRQKRRSSYARARWYSLFWIACQRLSVAQNGHYEITCRIALRPIVRFPECNYECILSRAGVFAFAIRPAILQDSRWRRGGGDGADRTENKEEEKERDHRRVIVPSDRELYTRDTLSRLPKGKQRSAVVSSFGVVKKLAPTIINCGDLSARKRGSRSGSDGFYRDITPRRDRQKT